MAVTNGDQFGHDEEWPHGPHLFDPKPYLREPHPGDLSYERWLKRPDVMFHATFRSDESLRNAPTLHTGTQLAAQEILNESAHNVGALPNTDSNPTTPGNLHSLSGIMMGREEQARRSMRVGTTIRSTMSQPDVQSRIGRGRIIARRYDSTGEYPETLTDETANHMDYVYRESIGEDVTGSVAASFTPPRDDDGEYDWSDWEDHPAIDALWEGKRLPYKNTFEDSGSTSYVVPKWTETTKGYWDDVEDSPNTTSAQKDMARIMRAEGETTVPFTSRPKTSNQGAMFTPKSFSAERGGVQSWETHRFGTFRVDPEPVEARYYSRPNPEWNPHDDPKETVSEPAPDLSKVKLVVKNEPKPAF